MPLSYAQLRRKPQTWLQRHLEEQGACAKHPEFKSLWQAWGHSPIYSDEERQLELIIGDWCEENGFEINAEYWRAELQTFPKENL